MADIHRRDAVLTGHGLVKADDAAATAVSAGNVALIPPGTKQRITDKGTGLIRKIWPSAAPGSVLRTTTAADHKEV